MLEPGSPLFQNNIAAPDNTKPNTMTTPFMHLCLFIPATNGLEQNRQRSVMVPALNYHWKLEVFIFIFLIFFFFFLGSSEAARNKTLEMG